MTKVNPVFVKLGIVACGMIGTALYADASGYGYQSSPSMPPGIYRIQSGFPTTRGSIAIFCPAGVALAYLRAWKPDEAKNGRCPSGSERFLKYVAALPGDRVDVRRDGVHVNGGVALPGSIALSRVPGEFGIHPMPKLARSTWLIPRGQIWAYTPQWFSLDSRYYGPVSVSLVGTAKLIAHDTPTSTMPPDVAKLQGR